MTWSCTGSLVERGTRLRCPLWSWWPDLRTWWPSGQGDCRWFVACREPVDVDVNAYQTRSCSAPDTSASDRLASRSWSNCLLVRVRQCSDRRRANAMQPFVGAAVAQSPYTAETVRWASSAAQGRAESNQPCQRLVLSSWQIPPRACEIFESLFASLHGSTVVCMCSVKFL